MSFKRKKIGVGILGFGTVGTGVIRILNDNAEEIRNRLGIPLVLVKVADLDLNRDRGVTVDRLILTREADEVLSHPDVDIVVELIGGHQPAKDLILKAFKHGLPVVTANKALLADDGEEIYRAARESGVDLGFEASVGGGIPILRAIREGLSADRIESIYGIINGTANYILSKMTHEGRSFSDVLQEAQAAGFAEANPSLDVDGFDTAHKLCILVALAFGTPVSMKSIFTEGIGAVQSMDVSFAKELGYRVKLLAIAKRLEESIDARVHPTMIPEGHPMASVEGVFNAIQIVGNAVGETLFYGKGAGAMPTGSAVVGDLIEVARNLLHGSVLRVPATAYCEEYRSEIGIKPIEEINCPYYLRFMVLDQPSVLSRISGLLGQHDISIASVLQKARHTGRAVPLVMMTHRASERNVRLAINEIKRLQEISEAPCLIRVEEDPVEL